NVVSHLKFVPEIAEIPLQMRPAERDALRHLTFGEHNRTRTLPSAGKFKSARRRRDAMEQQRIHSAARENLDRRAGMRRVVVIRNDVLERAPFSAAGNHVAAHLVVVTATD